MAGSDGHLKDALIAIETSTTKTRAARLEDLRDILDRSSSDNNESVLGNDAYLQICEVLFKITLAERAVWFKAKVATKKTLASRLSDGARTLRHVIDCGLSTVKFKTVKALINHVLSTMVLSDDTLCEPLALDYARCLRSILRYGPHVEHLDQQTWHDLVAFCVAHVRSTSEDSLISPTATYKLGSQRTQVAELVAEELLVCLQMLTGATNAPVTEEALEILEVILEYRLPATASVASTKTALAVISNILSRIVAENIRLVKSKLQDLVRTVQRVWHMKSDSLKDEILCILIWLMPFLTNELRTAGDAALVVDCRNLYEVIYDDYAKRPPKNQLRLSDIQLCSAVSINGKPQSDHTKNGNLRLTKVTASQSWATVQVLSSLAAACDKHNIANLVGKKRHSDGQPRPSKRLRLDTDLGDQYLLLHDSDGAIDDPALTDLQCLTFVPEDYFTIDSHLRNFLNSLVLSCTSTDHNISTWSYLAASNIAHQRRVSQVDCSEQWLAIWRLAIQAVGRPNLCRAACHAMNALRDQKLVSESSWLSCLETTNSSSTGDEISVLCDSSLQLAHAISKTNGSAVSSANQKISLQYLRWALKNWSPSNIDFLKSSAILGDYQLKDLSRLLASLLMQSCPDVLEQPHPQSTITDIVIAQANANKKLLDYLLLVEDESDTVVHRVIEPSNSISTSAGKDLRTSLQNVLLDHLESQVPNMAENLTEILSQRPRTLSEDGFTAAIRTYLLLALVLYDLELGTPARVSVLRDHYMSINNALVTYMSSTACSTNRFDHFLHLAEQLLVKDDIQNGRQAVTIRRNCRSAENIALCVDAVAGSRRAAQESDSWQFDSMQIDQGMGNKAESQSSDASSQSNIASLIASRSSATAMRVRVRQSAALLCLPFDNSSSDDILGVRRTAVDVLLAHSDGNLIPALDFLVTSQECSKLKPDEVGQLLEALTTQVLRRYEYSRSEAALSACVDVMSATCQTWADAAHPSLHGLGLDIYEWLTSIAITAKVLSPVVQEKLAGLLTDLCQIDPSYGSQTTDSSARTSLFRLVNTGPAQVQFFLSSRLSTIFAVFPSSEHGQMFDDLQNNLPVEVTWLEGISMRLLVLSELAIAWRSLLRVCVYYIFETAGRFTDFGMYAIRCMQRISSHLKMSSSAELFSIFGPQLIYTWLDSHHLENIPFKLFDYHSIDSFYAANQLQIAAQVFLKSDERAIDLVASTLQTSAAELLRQPDTFALTYAYTLGWDILYNSSEAKHKKEDELRTTIGGKEEARHLVKTTFPAVLGHSLRSVNMDKRDDTWLSKHADYAPSASALNAMKSYSQSPRQLPDSQQPHFKIKYLPNQLERIARRLNKASVSLLWDASSYSLAVQMLLDETNSALGSVHDGVVLDKIRLLIALGGQTAHKGHPLESTIRAVIPFLDQIICADDVIGILHHLLSSGIDYLAENWAFTLTTCTLIVMYLLKLQSELRSQSSSQSQYSQTSQHSEKFKSWLHGFFGRIVTSIPAESAASVKTMFAALSELSLPGNATKGTPESKLLLFLLKCIETDSEVMSKADAMHALDLLCNEFVAPQSIEEDCLGEDSLAIESAHSVWQVSCSVKLDSGFRSWIMRVISRAYSATGSRSAFYLPSTSQKRNESLKKIYNSEVLLAQEIENLVHSFEHRRASVGAFTGRSMLENDKDGVFASATRKVLSANLLQAFSSGTHGYTPEFLQRPSASAVDEVNLRTIFGSLETELLGSWCSTIGLTICQWSAQSNQSVLQGLPYLLHNNHEYAERLLPSIVHMALKDKSDQTDALRSALAKGMEEHFTDQRPELIERQKYLLRILLYLKEQPYPGEKTLLDRMQWIPVSYLLAAECAARCGMPTVSLQFAELARSPVSLQRRGSRLSSLEPVEGSIANEMLLTIFKMIDEPDSYYGVDQTTSLHSFIERSEYEGNNLQTLYLKSADLNSMLAQRHKLDDADAIDIMPSLSRLNLHVLTMMLAQGSSTTMASTASSTLEAARLLQQWDIVIPDDDKTSNTLLYRAVTSVMSPVSSFERVKLLDDIIAAQTETRVASTRPSLEWLASLSTLIDIREVVAADDITVVLGRLELSASRYKWTRLASFEGFRDIVLTRPVLYAVLADNTDYLQAHSFSKTQMLIQEAKTLATVAQLARKHGEVEVATSAAFSLDRLARAVDVNLRISGMNKCETAAVLWQAGEQAASLSILKDVAEQHTSGNEDVEISLAGLLAQIGSHASDARLEKPSDIIQNYLQPAIDKLGSKIGQEAGHVFHTFANFCDAQLQNPAATEDFERISALRNTKLEEVQQLQALISANRKSSEERQRQERLLKRTKTWFNIDDEDYQRLKRNRDVFVKQSLSNYMLALKASDDHNHSILRLFALWLENHETNAAQDAVDEEIETVPSWKFVVLMNQLLSRLDGDPSAFQKTLFALIQRICDEHVYQTVHHVYAARKTQGKEAQLRRDTAAKLSQALANRPKNGDLFKRMLSVDSLYRMLAEEPGNQKVGVKVSLRESVAASKVQKHAPLQKIPPATIEIPLQPDGVYRDVPVITSFANTMTLASGLSAPKILSAQCSDGKLYKQLFKGGNDDLRQDAIMEQVFGEVSKMLQNHKSSRQRSLQVRTYKVIPLSAHAGIIEFVPNSIPINDFLQPAHQQYFPGSMKGSAARQKLGSVQDHSTETRVKEYRKVCEQIPPVMRFFFFERFTDPDEWFEKRIAYTRTTAAISILGQVLGLGDRHCHNILLDELSGEVVHIDLGVAFEAGRVLPVPELVPFRLTRDIVDGMGITGVEGVFKRCCEFTLEALREDKDGIMTLLNVLRYDPLYSWTLSPLKARRMQEQQEGETALNGAAEPAKKANNDTYEASRALAVVEKKLGKALSVSATVSELIQRARDERNLATLFNGWSAFY